ncbi:MAG: hypothetical protein ACXW13_07905 [Burkholderiaceae bacterium]
MPHIASYPRVRIGNDQLEAQLYLPDAANGFYQGTRFDWSGVIAGLQYRGHEYYEPWYTKRVPEVWDYVDDGVDIVVGRQSAITGPAEEFPQPQGFDTAQAGDTFVKLGVGVLRRATDSPYSCYESYEVVDPGIRSVRKTPTSVACTHRVSDARTGMGCVYRKTVSTTPGGADLVIEHSLHNTGRVAIRAEQYNHNFLTLDSAPIGPDFLITLPFRIHAPSTLDFELAAIQGNEIRFVKPLAPGEVVSFPVRGFTEQSRDYDIRVENRKLGAGVRMTGNRPLTKLTLWSIRSVLSMEPFIDVSTEPGGRTLWAYTYTHYVVDM